MEKVRPDVKQAAPEPAKETSGELFLDAEAAERPIDLSGELEAGAPTPDRGRALQAEVEGLLAKSTGAAERALLTELRRGLRRGGLQLPPMPQVILRVHRLISSGDFNMQDVARQIELDPALATKMVGIANSPFYAGMEPAQSVRDSIVRIGMLETRNILMVSCAGLRGADAGAVGTRPGCVGHHPVAGSAGRDRPGAGLPGRPGSRCG
jgi:hypothetical protein